MENIIYIILTVLFIVILIVLGKYNSLIRLQNKVKKSKASIDIYLNKRFDLIPNIVECVKSYSKHEENTLTEIVSLRNEYKNNQNININEAERYNNKLNKYIALVESYPELKANTQYLDLQQQLKETEQELAQARHIYNNDVTNYNTAIEVVPSNVVALIFNFKKADLFKIDESRENININL